jgi:tRNA (cmo5U34)-methyltransferase
MAHFSDHASVARYAEGPRRLVPGLEALHRMTLLLLAERAPKDARVLVLGAGGGMELKVFAEGQPEWRFDGIDPAAAMLRLAEEVLGPLAAHVSLHEGYIESAPDRPFDAATCLLTLHFLSPEERLRTLQEVRRRMKPGAPFVVAHHSFPRDEAGRELWSSRFAEFAVASGVDRGMMETGRGFIAHQLPALSPEEDEASLRAAGFSDVSLFYAAFTFRGWVAYA